MGGGKTVRDKVTTAPVDPEQPEDPEVASPPRRTASSGFVAPKGKGKAQALRKKPVLERKVVYSRESFEHDGVEWTGRIGAFLGVLAILCFVPAFMIDDMVVLVGVSESTTGIGTKTNVHLGGWQNCWQIPIDRFQCEEHRVCFDYSEQIRTSGTACTYSGSPDTADAVGSSANGTNDTIDGDSGSGSAIAGTEGTAAPPDGGATGTPREGDVCSILGQGNAWCSVLRYLVQAVEAVAIIFGLVGDVLSDKVHAILFFNQKMFAMSMLSFLMMYIIPCIIYAPKTAEVVAPGISAYCVLLGAVSAKLGALCCQKDLEYYPNTRRFGFANDGLGVCQRLGALTGVFAWATIGMAVCSSRWSETDQLSALGQNLTTTTEPVAVHFSQYGLDVVSKASWGMTRYCIELPVSVLQNGVASVCLQYEERFTVVANDGSVSRASGCEVFENGSNYNLCETRDIIITLSVICIGIGMAADTFSEKVKMNIVCMAAIFMTATSCVGVWLLYWNQAVSGPTEYGAASQVYVGAGFYLCLTGAVSALGATIAYILDSKRVCWKWEEHRPDDDDDIDEKLPCRPFDCCDCIEYTCYGDDMGPSSQIRVKHTHVSYSYVLDEVQDTVEHGRQEFDVAGETKIEDPEA
mmetsp:Transcript_13916/g.35812  ORF Transcript_13916/g.35812 Transcript_13916/m.35812 type:complete len:635 (+) Transcript_13916:202-2106(+)